MWQYLIPMAASALMGAQSAQRKADQQKAFNLSQAEMTRYSPYTGHAGQLDNSYRPSQMEGAFGGAVQGFGMGQALSGAGIGGTPNPTAGMDSSQKQIYNGIAGQDQPYNRWALMGGDAQKLNGFQNT